MTNHGTQFELFPFLQGRPAALARPRYLLKDLTLSIENIIVLSIIFIMTMVLFFSFGVERGKRVVRSSLIQAANGGEPRQGRAAAAGPERQAEPRAVVETNVKTPKVDMAQKAVATQGSPVSPAKPDVQPSPQKKETGVFTIQVASFKDKGLARKEANLLQEKGYKIFVLPKGSHSIVCVGKFTLRDEARQFSNNLKSRYNDCLVRRL
ncbi:MAG: SPOR domain-containing protein [Candidatus Omnitrophica bacterium]|nr:SPOR domain-containing protein [Candidatus Omnitrophota bacterium]